MPTVAELDVKVDAQDDATAKLLALDALIKSLEGDDVKIDVDVSDTAEAELAAIEASLAAINGEDVSVEVDIDSAAAMRELEAINVALQALSDENVNVDLDTEAATAQLDVLRARLAALGDTNVDVDLDIAGATARIALLEAELKAIPDEKVTVEVNTDRAKTNLNRLSAAAVRSSGSINGIAAAVLGLGPALVPIGAVAVGGIAALGAGLSVAAIGAAAFASVAVTTFSPVANAYTKLTALQEQYNTAVNDKARDTALQKMKALMDSLPPSQQAMVKELQNFSSEWHRFAAQFQPEIFTMATTGLRAMTALLPSLTPIFQGAVHGFHNLETSAIAALNGPFWQEFIHNVGGAVQPLITGLGHSIGNLITGFAGIINAFIPLSMDFTGGLEGMTASFSRWGQGLATNKGFQSFVSYVRENTPKVLESIGSLVSFLIDLVQAAAPIGGVLLTAITKLIEAFSALQNAHPILAALVLGFVGLGVGLLKLAGPILAIVNVFTLLAPAFAAVGEAMGGIISFLAAFTAPAWIVVALVAALVAGLIYAYIHFAAFRDAVNGAAGAVVDFAQRAGAAILSGLGAAWAWLVSTFGPGISTVIEFVRGEFQKIVDWANQNAATFATAWSHIVTVVQIAMTVLGALIMAGLRLIEFIWNAVWPGLSTVLQGVWTVISGIISGALQVIRGIILVFAGLLAGDWSAVWSGLTAIFNGLWGAFTAVLMGALQIVLGLFQIFGGVLAAYWGVIWGAIKAVAVAAFNALVAVLSAGLAALQALWSAAWGAIVSVARTLWSGFVAFVTGVWNALVAFVLAALATLHAGWTAGWNAIKAGAVAAFNAIRAALTGWVAGMIAAIVGFIALALARWLSFWNSVSSTASSMIARVRSVVSAGLASVTSAISSFVSSAIARIQSWASQMASSASSAMSRFVSAISSGVGRAVSALVSGVARMAGAVAGAGGRFFSAGASLISSLVSGVTSRIGAAVSAVKGAVSRMTALLPGSPAETGPLSGSGYALYRGQHLSEDLAAGIASKAGEVGLAASDLADLMTLKMNPTAAFEAITQPITNPSPATGGGTTINLSIEPGAVAVTVSTDDPEGAADALSGAADDLADRLLTALRRS